MTSESTNSGPRDHLDELMERMQRRSLSSSELMQLRAHAATCEACALLLELGPKLAASVAPRASDALLDQRVVARSLGRTHHGRSARTVMVLALSAAAMLIGSVAAARYFGAWPAPGAAVPIATPSDRSSGSARAVSAPPSPARAPQVAEPAEPPSPAISRDPEASAVAPPTESAAELFASANQLRRSGQDAAAISAYRGLQQRYPSSPEARLSRATLGTLLLQRGDASGALQEFDRYIQVGGSVLEEALAGRARALGVLGDARAEARAWRLLLERFPGSVHAARARTRLAELR
jgi:hypothetical protein